MVKTARIEEPKGKAAPLPDLSATASNYPDREETLFMVGQISQAKAKVKEARQAEKRIRSNAKLRGFNLTQLDLAIAEREREDMTTIENLRDFKRYCEFLNLPVGSQISLFDSAAQPADQTTVLNTAYQKGYERGLMGQNPDDQAYPPFSPEGQQHMTGWNAGQAINREKFIKLSEEMKAADEARAAKKAAKQAEAEADEPEETQH